MTISENGKPTRSIRFEPQQDDPAQFSQLSPKERAAIREKARLTVANELKDREEKALLAAYIKEERQKIDPDEILVPIWLNLALNCPYIMIDGTQYFSEHLYNVTPALFATLAEIQNRGWAHDEETEVRDAKSRRRHRPPPHVGVGNFMDNRNPRDLVVSSRTLQSTNPNTLLGIRA
jgi:hypothetical protein